MNLISPRTVLFLSSIISIPTSAQFKKRTDPASYNQPVMKAIAYGITAPNPHNSQMWYIDTLSSTVM